jgi:hypothetical protein
MRHGRALLVISFTNTDKLLKQLVALGCSHVDHSGSCLQVSILLGFVFMSTTVASSSLGFFTVGGSLLGEPFKATEYAGFTTCHFRLPPKR